MTDNFGQKVKTNLSCRTRSGIQAFKVFGFRLSGRNDKRKSFTLIELLVVLALVAILSVVVILTLNPAELLKQARDSNRLSDLATINTALNLFSTDVTSGFMGTSTVVYVSLSSTTSTCSNLGLPTLPTGYTYNCVTSQNLRNTDGTGWIPVNFNRISSNSPISQLPIDPTNTTSTRLYYTYTPGGSWELNATVEASKNKLGGSNDLVSKDGGTSPSTYELGNNLTLTPIETGDPTLVGYWNFEEGPNATSSDRSGYGNHGTWYGTSTAQEHYAAGKVGQYAGSFNGGSDCLAARGYLSSYNADRVAMAFWARLLSSAEENDFLVGRAYNNTNVPYFVDVRNAGKFSFGTWAPGVTASASTAQTIGVWYYAVGVYDGSAYRLYLNGILNNSSLSSQVPTTNNLGFSFGCFDMNGSLGRFGNFEIDDVRIYNRSLSAEEVSSLYQSVKYK